MGSDSAFLSITFLIYKMDIAHTVPFIRGLEFSVEPDGPGESGGTHATPMGGFIEATVWPVSRGGIPAGEVTHVPGQGPSAT